MPQTAIGAALQKAGVDPCLVQLDIAVSMFINKGRSEGEVHRLVSAAYAKSRKAIAAVPKGQSQSASPRPELPGQAIAYEPQGQMTTASLRQPQSDEEGQAPRADEAMVVVPSPSPLNDELPEQATIALSQDHAQHASLRQPQSDGEGHSGSAAKANGPVLSPSPLLRKQHNAALTRKVMTHVAKTLATVTINDYMVIGDDGKVRPLKRGELRSHAKKHRKKAMLYEATAEYLDRFHPNGDMATDVTDLIDLPTYEKIAQEVVYA